MSLLDREDVRAALDAGRWLMGQAVRRLWAWLRARPTWPKMRYNAFLGVAIGLGLAELDGPRVQRTDYSEARWCARALRVFARTPSDTLDLITLKPECAAFVIERRAARFVPDNYVPARD